MSSRLTYTQILKTKEGKRYYKPLKYPSIPSSLNDIYIITTIEDRLDTLAYRYYKDTELWWIIASANPQNIRRDSYSLKPNLEIRIPTKISPIKKLYLILQNFWVKCKKGANVIAPIRFIILIRSRFLLQYKATSITTFCGIH